MHGKTHTVQRVNWKLRYDDVSITAGDKLYIEWVLVEL